MSRLLAGRSQTLPTAVTARFRERAAPSPARGFGARTCRQRVGSSQVRFACNRRLTVARRPRRGRAKVPADPQPGSPSAFLARFVSCIVADADLKEMHPAGQAGIDVYRRGQMAHNTIVHRRQSTKSSVRRQLSPSACRNVAFGAEKFAASGTVTHCGSWLARWHRAVCCAVYGLLITPAPVSDSGSSSSGVEALSSGRTR